ncbi:MAG: glycosyltransferase family 8 protein [Oscillospiraceae bacterium]|nr:glycosyltransferase family 8 protein [Oscillospiraceae bacterium]
MNILYTFDDKFAPVAGVSILSLFENNKDADEINVYIVENDVSDANKQRLIKLQNDYERKIIFKDAPDVEKIAGTTIGLINNRWPLANFFRLFISSILPADMEKIIYLDCDTIIRSSIAGLWNMEQGKSVISGVRVYRKLFDDTGKYIYLKKRDTYINAGVMLINLDLWRLYNVEEKFIKFIRLIDGKTLHGKNQGIINSVLKGFIGTIDPTYNYRITENKNFSHPKDRKRISQIQRDNNPVIAHYIAIGERIDKYKSAFNIALSDDWYKWKEMSPWKDLPLDYLRAQDEVPQSLPNKNQTKDKKTLRSSLLSFTERKCKPVFNLLNSFGSYRKFFLKNAQIIFIQPLHIRKYNKHRQKITGINIKDCRIGKRT